MDLHNKTFSGVRWTSISTISVAILQMLQIAILARLLTPDDFGLMSLVMVVIGFSQAFIDMGISNAIIHKREVTEKQLGSLYWLNILSGLVVFSIIVLCSGYIASFYAEPKLKDLVIIVSISFLIQPFGHQFMILWQKEMRFSEIAKIEIFAKLTSFFVSICLAWKEFGVDSLVYGTLASVCMQTLLLLLAGLKEHKPLFRLRLSEISDFTSFGLYQVGERTVNYFNSQIDTILIGKFLGVEILGIYNIAKQLVMKPSQIFNPIVTRVTFPAMAKIQHDLIKLKDVYLKTINYLASINFPIYAFMFLFSAEIIQLLFGNGWEKAIPVLKILSLWGALRSIGNPIGSLLLARGEAKRGFLWNFAMFFYTPVGIYLGSKWGIEGISWALLLMSFPLGFIASWKYLVKPLSGIKFSEYSLVVLKPTLISILASIFPLLIVKGADLPLVAELAIGLSLGAIVVILFNLLINKDFIFSLRKLIGK